VAPEKVAVIVAGASPSATSTSSIRANTRSGKKKAALRGRTRPGSGASNMVAEATSSDARGAVEVAVQMQSVSTEGRGVHQASLSASDSAVDGVNPSDAVSKSHLGVFANTHDHKLAEPVTVLDLPTDNSSKTGISDAVAVTAGDTEEDGAKNATAAHNGAAPYVSVPASFDVSHAIQPSSSSDKATVPTTNDSPHPETVTAVANTVTHITCSGTKYVASRADANVHATTTLAGAKPLQLRKSSKSKSPKKTNRDAVKRKSEITAVVIATNRSRNSTDALIKSSAAPTAGVLPNAAMAIVSPSKAQKSKRKSSDAASASDSAFFCKERRDSIITLAVSLHFLWRASCPTET
jgi:hypothetical protein